MANRGTRDKNLREFESRTEGTARPALISRLPKEALLRLDADIAAFRADFVPRLEREANRDRVKDAILLRDLAVHFFDIVAREVLEICHSPEEYEAALWGDIGRFVHFGLTQYPFIAEPMREELDQGFTFHVLRTNPWTGIPKEERDSVWHVGALLAEGLSHAALRWEAEARRRLAAGCWPQAGRASVSQQEVKVGRRRLAAIMFTDIVGYSAMTQRNEALAQEVLNDHNRVLRAIFSNHSGTEVKTTGDGFLVEFASALDAARCAIGIQQALFSLNRDRPLEKRFQVRIGLHVGDVMPRENDVSGDAVNIAARILPLAEPGGICLSQDVARQIENKIDLRLQRMGRPELKNIQRPLEVYRVVLPR